MWQLRGRRCGGDARDSDRCLMCVGEDEGKGDLNELLLVLLKKAHRIATASASLNLVSRRDSALEIHAMASVVAVAGPCAVLGLGISSLSGQKLRVSARPASVRAAPSVGVVAKYDVGNSKYFDLEDLGNTTGNWDLYGSDQLSPYNGMQSKFFETFAAPFTKRGLLLKLGLLGGSLALGFASSSATGDILAIKNGPKNTPLMGPRDRI